MNVSSGTGSPGLSRTKGRKTVVVVVVGCLTGSRIGKPEVNLKVQLVDQSTVQNAPQCENLREFIVKNLQAAAKVSGMPWLLDKWATTTVPAPTLPQPTDRL